MPVAGFAVQVHDCNDAECAVIDPINHGIRESLQAGLARFAVELSPQLRACVDLGNDNLGGGGESLAKLVINAAIIKRSFFQFEDGGIVPEAAHADLAALWAASLRRTPAMTSS
jgi:hypothetical protein